MLRVKNISTLRIVVSEVKRQENVIEPNETQSFMETDEVVKSYAEGTLKDQIDAGNLEIVADAERADIDKLIAQISSANAKIIFEGDKAGALAGEDVEISSVDANDVVNTFDSVSEVTVTITGGTATTPTIDGGAGPVDVTVVDGVISVEIAAAGAGTVILGLSAGPAGIDVSDTITVTLS